MNITPVNTPATQSPYSSSMNTSKPAQKRKQLNPNAPLIGAIGAAGFTPFITPKVMQSVLPEDVWFKILDGNKKTKFLVALLNFAIPACITALGALGGKGIDMLVEKRKTTPPEKRLKIETYP